MNRGSPLALGTPQQRRLVDQWYATGSLKAAAASLHISLHTARSHMKSLYDRTGARGSVDVFFWLGQDAAGDSPNIR